MPSDVGGVSTWIQALAPDLRRRGLDVRVHISNGHDQPGPNIRHFEAQGVPVRSGKAPQTMLGCVRQCVDWLNLDRPDIYIPNSVLPAYYAGGYARQFGLQTVGVLHADDAYFAAIIEEFVAKNPQSRFSAVVPVSDYLRRRVESFGIPNLRCVRIPCGVPVPQGRTAFDPQHFKIVYLGRLVEVQKQVSKVTRALCEAASRHPSLEAIIVGDGPARGSVEQIVREHPHGNRVRLTGRLNNREVYDLLQSMQAFVLLSDYEGLPVSLLEAMATGVVPICLKMRSGIQEVIQHGTNGFVVEDRDESFQAVVSRLMADPAIWEACSTAARATVEREFSMENCHQKWFELLTSMAESLPAVRYPIPMPSKVPTPHRDFGWNEPDALERLFPFTTPLRDRVGRWRRTLMKRITGAGSLPAR
jgi:glycosyltransferase involved in cell wall biosynthesis